MVFPADRDAKRRALLDAVERVSATLAAGAAEAERAGTLPAATVAALEETGLFRLKLPALLGGAEADPLTQIDVLEAVSRVDASAGWCLMVGATLVAVPGAYLPDDGVAEMFAGGRVPRGAGVIAPTGRAVPVDGGYRVTGRWSFASGVRHAEWIGVGVQVQRASQAPPEIRQVFLPTSAVTVHDSWHVMGLQGTGSCDVSADDVFVPDRRVIDIAAPARRGGPLYRLGFPGFVANEHAAFALGVARRALDEIAALAVTTRRSLGGASWLVAERESIQRMLGESDLRLRAARALAVETYEEAWRLVGEGGAPGAPLQLRMRGAAVLATEVATDVVTRAFRAAGGRAVHLDGVLQRCLRDLHAGAQHFLVSDSAYAAHGRALLGLPGAEPMA